MRFLKKVLLIESRRLCYDSSQYILERFETFLQKHNIEVVRFDYDALCKNPQKLEKFLGMSFDAVFDCNSQLPGVYQDDKLFLNAMNIPFFHRILDHPLHLHPSLNIPLQQENIICLDSGHASYIKKAYPHIKNVFVLPFIGTKLKDDIPFAKKTISLLFPATYIPLSFLEEKIKEQRKEDVLVAQDILTACLQGNKEEIETLYMSFSKDNSLNEETLAQQMYQARFIDRYVRAGLREYVVNQVIQHDIPIEIVGDNWEFSPFSKEKAITFHPSCSYQKSLTYFSMAKAVLNVEPLFREAMHDRISNAFLQGAAVITDSCLALEKDFCDKEDYLLYQFQNLSANDSFWKTLQDSDLLEKIAYQGSKHYQSLYSYEKLWDELLIDIEKSFF